MNTGAVLGAAAIVIGLVQISGEIENRVSEAATESIRIEGECRTAVERLDERIAALAAAGASDEQFSELSVSQNVRERFQKNISYHIARQVSLLYAKHRFYLLPSQVDRDRQRASRHNCVE